MKFQKATFGAGCFWGVEKAFSDFGKTAVGFMGGAVENPSYKQVCSGRTGHVEVCQIEYDPKKVGYERLLEIFWKIHNPTQLSRQGLNFGEQYKSVIFYHNEKQKKLALSSKGKEQKKYKRTVVTEILPAKGFYKAEEYHQKYFEKKRFFF
jgi:peptide-methionine (S)-S-oxide reductase